MTKNYNNLPRDVFLHLLAIITLVASAISFGILLFEFININVPDVISDPYFSASGHYSSMRYALATLVVVFAVFLWDSWFIRKDITAFPEKRDLKIRKWLLYLTLFAAALVIIGDLVALLRSFLEGELSQRFVLKVFSILFIAGSVFIHYLSELRDKDREFSWIRIFDWVIVALVLAGVVSGFLFAGTPQNQRLVRLDERRVGDLQTIQWQIINYWQRKESLPVNLNELADPISGFTVPRDPQTGGSYEYSSSAKLKFQLCAVFETSNLEGRRVSDMGNVKMAPPTESYPVGGYIDYGNVWWHDIGRTCFERTIDPELYPPLKDKDPAPRPL